VAITVDGLLLTVAKNVHKGAIQKIE